MKILNLISSVHCCYACYVCISATYLQSITFDRNIVATAHRKLTATLVVSGELVLVVSIFGTFIVTISVVANLYACPLKLNIFV
jgi:hypothetical protein